MGEKPRPEDEADERKGGTMSAVQNLKREGDDGGAAEAGDAGAKAMPSNLNPSKSNINREAGGEGGAGPPAPSDATTVKSSKSNSSE